MLDRPGRMALWLGLVAGLVGLDQASKQMAEALLTPYMPHAVVPGFFNLTLAYNPGAAFSFLADAGGWQRWFFTAIALGASVVILIWLARLTAAEKLQGVALALILGGALGNFYDRLVLGHVVDFLDFYWGNSHFPAFNIADTAITIGAGLILLDMFLGAGNGAEKKEARKKHD
ncbi:MAG TPA: signal peptidase II [Gammaproteobacteria bacterium]|nr:signal peptidase II [Gammaproteobacteria bacterium]